MGKEKFERNKPHCNIGTIIKLIKLPKRKHVVLRSLQHTLNMKQMHVTMHTLTVLDTPIT